MVRLIQILGKALRNVSFTIYREDFRSVHVNLRTLTRRFPTAGKWAGAVAAWMGRGGAGAGAWRRETKYNEYLG